MKMEHPSTLKSGRLSLKSDNLKLIPKFREKIYSHFKGRKSKNKRKCRETKDRVHPIPESLRRFASAISTNNELLAVNFLMTSYSSDDKNVVDMYSLVKNDESGREHLLSLFSSKDQFEYSQRFYDFILYLTERDLHICGASPKNKLKSNILSLLNSYSLVGTKLFLVKEAFSRGDKQSLRAFLHAKSFTDLKKTSSINGYKFFKIHSNMKNDYLELIHSLGENFRIKKFVLKSLDLSFISEAK